MSLVQQPAATTKNYALDSLHAWALPGSRPGQSHQRYITPQNLTSSARH